MENSLIGTSWELEWHSMEQPRDIERWVIPALIALYVAYIIYYYFWTAHLKRRGFDIIAAADDFQAPRHGDDEASTAQVKRLTQRAAGQAERSC